MNNTPYTYLIGWSNLKIYYYGVRYAKYCHPNDLWVSYFTSSKYVKDFIEQHGNPDIVKVRKTFKSKHDAIEWEHKFLKKIKADTNIHFLNKHINNGRRFKNYENLSEKTKQKISISLKKYFENEDNLNSHKERIKNRPPVSDTTKQKLKDIRSDLIWITNNQKDKMIHEYDLQTYVDQGWIKGRKNYVPITKGTGKQKIKKTPEELKQIRRDAQLGFKQSKESIEKRVDKTSKKFLITTPNNEEVVIKNLAQYCRENNLIASCMHHILKGMQTHHKGYKIKRLD